MTPPDRSSRADASHDRWGAFGTLVHDLRRAPLRTAVVATLGALTALVLFRAVRTASSVLLLLLAAAYLAVGLDPLVGGLSRRTGMRRGFAVAVVLLGVIGVVVGLSVAVAPVVARQVSQLVHQAPTMLQQLRTGHSAVDRLAQRLHLVQNLPTSGELTTRLLNAAHGVLGIGKLVVSAAVATLLFIVVTAMTLLELPRLKRRAYRLVPRSRRARVGLIGDSILDRVGKYVLGAVLVSFVMGAGTLIVLLLVRVPYAFGLAAFVALIDLVPVIGSTLGAIAVTGVALSVSLRAGLIVLAYYLVYRLAEDYLLIPRVMNRAVEVPPAAVVLAVLLGTALLGILGALLAVPTAAAVRLVLQEIVYPSQDTR